MRSAGMTWAIRITIFLSLTSPAFGQDHGAASKPTTPPDSGAVEISPVDAKGNLIPGEYVYTIGGLRQWFKVAGQGPACILPTPGWGPSSYLYTQSMGELEKSFTVVYFDTRGSGQSQPPRDIADMSRAKIVADLEALRMRLGQDKVWMLGHSTGSALVLQYALDYPQHLSGMIIVGATITNDKKAHDAAQKQSQRVLKEPWFPTAMRAMKADVLRMRVAGDLKSSVMAELPIYFHDQEKLRDVREIFDATDYSLPAAIGMISANPTPPMLEPRLGEIKTPTLIIAGASDIDASPYQAGVLHDGIKGSKLVVIPEAGHFPWMEQPEKFFAAVHAGVAELR